MIAKRMRYGLIIALTSSLSVFAQVDTLITEYGTFHGIWQKVNPHRLVILIPGSGPVDADGNAGSMKGNSLKYTAEAIAAFGWSTLQTDKLNAHRSEASPISLDTLTYSLYEQLIADWLDYAKSIGFKEFVLLGHSQGSLTAARVARNRPEVIGVMSVCGAGEPIAEILKRQLAQQFPEPLMSKIATGLDSIARGYAPSSPHILVESYFSEANRHFLHSWMALDPCDAYTGLSIPVGIIYGENDVQVDTAQAIRLHECSHQSTLYRIEGMGHMLKKAPGVLAFAQSYYGRSDLPLHPDFILALTNFLEQL